MSRPPAAIRVRLASTGVPAFSPLARRRIPFTRSKSLESSKYLKYNSKNRRFCLYSYCAEKFAESSAERPAISNIEHFKWNRARFRGRGGMVLGASICEQPRALGWVVRVKRHAPPRVGAALSCSGSRCPFIPPYFDQSAHHCGAAWRERGGDPPDGGAIFTLYFGPSTIVTE